MWIKCWYSIKLRNQDCIYCLVYIQSWMWLNISNVLMPISMVFLDNFIRCSESSSYDEHSQVDHCERPRCGWDHSLRPDSSFFSTKHQMLITNFGWRGGWYHDTHWDNEVYSCIVCSELGEVEDIYRNVEDPSTIFRSLPGSKSRSSQCNSVSHQTYYKHHWCVNH